MICVSPNKEEFRIERPPVPMACECGQKDNVVLPRGRGVLRYECGCGRRYRMEFNRNGGNTYLET